MKRQEHIEFLKTLISLFLLIVVAIAKGTKAEDGVDRITTHEQLGQSHYPFVELTPYESQTEYLGAKKGFWATALHPVFNITHFIFDNTVTSIPALPLGKIYDLLY